MRMFCDLRFAKVAIAFALSATAVCSDARAQAPEKLTILIFSPPSLGALLPPVDVVVQRAVERAKIEDEHEREFKALYHYVSTKATDYRNAKGELNPENCVAADFTSSR